MAGVADSRPADPIEGMLISQLVVGERGRAVDVPTCLVLSIPDDYFEAHTKYLQLADRASRTVALLTERLDQHRGRGQQQIVVKHVTVNADQAVVADTVVTGKPTGNEKPSPAPADACCREANADARERRPSFNRWGVEKGMSINPMHKAHAAPRCTAKSKRTGKPMSCTRRARLEGLPDARCSAVARPRANGMGITGTAPARRKPSRFRKFIKSLR